MKCNGNDLFTVACVACALMYYNITLFRVKRFALSKLYDVQATVSKMVPKMQNIGAKREVTKSTKNNARGQLVPPCTRL